MRRPRFKPCFKCEIVPSEGVFLISENSHFLLRGEAYIHLAPLLNGKYAVEEIADILQDKYSFVEIFYLLDRLHSKGYIADADIAVADEMAAFWEMLNLASEEANKRLGESTVSVISLGKIAAEPLKNMLASLGVQVSENGDSLPYPSGRRSAYGIAPLHAKQRKYSMMP